MDLLSLMRSARRLLEPHWIVAVGVCLTYALLVGIPAELNTYGELLSLLLAGPLQLGMSIYFLNLVRGNPPRLEQLFDGFKPLVSVLLMYATISLLTLIGLVLLIVPGIVIAVGLSMSFYILSENPELSFQAALEKSWKLTDGYKMELFLLNLRFIPWFLLGILCLLVGVFVVAAWHNTTLALYYQYLKEQQQKSFADV